MMKTAHLCEAYHMNIEPHSFGPTLVQAMHFHVMLAVKNCDFFESPVTDADHAVFCGRPINGVEKPVKDFRAARLCHVKFIGHGCGEFLTRHEALLVGFDG